MLPDLKPAENCTEEKSRRACDEFGCRLERDRTPDQSTETTERMPEILQVTYAIRPGGYPPSLLGSFECGR
jgi:hypothetical protein